MDRRKFLFRSASIVAGSFFGLKGFTRAFALEERNVPHVYSPRIALIIDDIGFSSPRTREFLELGIPITFSILPRLEKSRDLALEIHEKGHEIMLHQPMEPYNSSIDPGPGALYLGFPDDKIGCIIEENIDSVPYAIGVNNHMGSKYTESRKEVNEFLRTVNRAGFFFIDSLTTSRSTAYETARRLHMPAACRNTFLDHIPYESAIYCQLKKLIRYAFKYGHAVGIGHPYPETARVLNRFSCKFEEFGVSLVHASKILSPQDLTIDQGSVPSVTGDFT
jgi:polysaccharide deacetylase 2 family uncharacterized protein YibQ